MFEKVNPSHPDKIADRIAGRLVDIAYTRSEGGWLKSNPKIAVEVLIGHGTCNVIIETSCTRHELNRKDVEETVFAVTNGQYGPASCFVTIVEQDPHLADNQKGKLRCGDNGIFKGMPVTDEQKILTALAATTYDKYPTDGKYIIRAANTCLNRENPNERIILEKYGDVPDIIVCQSCASCEDLRRLLLDFGRNHLHDTGEELIMFDADNINPLGPWTGGLSTDSGATNRKLGSDMGDAVTGGGLHGKDLSKADVSVNIVCHLLAQESRGMVTACCAIGDESVTFRYHDPAYSLPTMTETYAYADIVEHARLYIFTQYGSFEKFAEWGLINPGEITE